MVMRDGGEREACDVAAKLRVTAALLDCAGQKELCAAFRRANPQTGFDLDRSYKWIQGRSLPRSPQIYEDWATVCGLDRPGSWVADSTLDEFVAALCAVRGVERVALLRRAGLGESATATDTRAPRRGMSGSGAEENYLCGAYACYSHAQSPYYRGRIVRGALLVAPAARRSEGLTARYSQALAVGLTHVAGPVLRGAGRSLAFILTTSAPATPPVFCQLLLPTPPGSLLAGMMSSFAMVDPGGQPPYATRFAAVRVPGTVEAVETSNRYMESEAMGLSRDLAALGLNIADATGLEARLSRYLNAPGDGRPGEERVTIADHTALAAACDRAWLDTLAAADDWLADGWQDKGAGCRPNSAA